MFVNTISPSSHVITPKIFVTATALCQGGSKHSERKETVTQTERALWFIMPFPLFSPNCGHTRTIHAFARAASIFERLAAHNQAFAVTKCQNSFFFIQILLY